MSVAGAVFRVGASILVALLIFEGASSVFGPGLSHLVPTWFTRLSRIIKPPRSRWARHWNLNMTLAEDKDAARKLGFAARAIAHAAERETAPAKVAALALELMQGEAPTVVSTYLPIRTEIDPRPAMHALHAAGHKICVPVIQGAGLALKFREWEPGCTLQPGPFGAAVPVGGDWLEPQVLLCPLVAFDDEFYRLGYGGGFYDRSLERLRAMHPVKAIGLAYAGQRAVILPREATDQPMDAMLTEAGLVWRSLAK